MAGDHDGAVLTRVPVRWLEVDAQGVVFHMWYLAYLEDARNAHLAATGCSLEDLLASGHDLQLVRTELVWQGSLRWGDVAEVTSRVLRTGSTSITLAFDLAGRGGPVLRAETVYVVVDRDAGGKRPIPDRLRAALHGVGPVTDESPR